jgi:hypothetical protein
VNRVAAALAQSIRGYGQSTRLQPNGSGLPDGAPALADNVLIRLALARDSFRPLVGEPKSSINLRLLGNDLTWMAKAKHSHL